MYRHLTVPFLASIPAETAASGNRVYVTPEGRRYPSVTTVLKEHSREGIQAWRQRVGATEANTVARRAAARGTRIHDLLEAHLRNDPMVPGIFDLEMYLSMEREAKRIDDIYFLETALWSDHLRLAGRTDCIARFDGKRSVVDWKTSLRPKKLEWIEGYAMQVAGYCIAFEERTGVPVDQGVLIIGIDDEPNAQVFIVKRDDWVEKLLYYRDLWEMKNGRI